MVCSEWLYDVLLCLTETTSSCRCTATRQRGQSSIGTSPLCQCHMSLASYLLSSVIPSCLLLVVTCHSGSPVIYCYLSMCFTRQSGSSVILSCLSFCLACPSISLVTHCHSVSSVMQVTYHSVPPVL